MSYIDIIGRSCRLPGANNIEEFWQLLSSGRSSVSKIDPERFSMVSYWNPRRGEKGKAYTFAAGVIDDVWGFDPGVFGISPREASQMDPQQRLLLMLVWEAFEDAGIPISSVAGKQVGVYVGNSMVDHNYRFLFDPAGGDSFMMTGNSMSLISNRISYIYDFHGPSETLDTACSSSLLAVDHAVTALRSGEIDMAVVAGVNLLMSPFPFVGFSAASMLSPVGQCRAFDKDAYGYVRAEGGVVLVLQRAGETQQGANRCYAQLLETGSNSDGRTMGVALPSAEYQGELLHRVYAKAGIDVNQLVFVEAHGTGTRVGDPAETTSLGNELGKKRQKPLPIGSVKTNVGHLEPASGLVGLLKAILSLENNAFPASLHFDTPNPDIPFDELNLQVNTELKKLDKSGLPRYAGVNSFGFGGTNVHAIIADPPAAGNDEHKQVSPAKYPMLLLSAHCEEALKELARQYLSRFDDCDDRALGEIINAVAYQRERMPQRLTVFGDSVADYRKALKSFVADKKSPNMASARATKKHLKTALVYSGNGSQWAGMGRQAFQHNATFARCFQEIDEQFQLLSDWSLQQMLFADDLADQLHSAQVSQLLLFAVQVALTDTLKSMGLKFDAVLGHSAGEVAAAYASGSLDLDQAVRIMHARSQYQEKLRGTGAMAAVSMSADEVQLLLQESQFAGAEVSAINAPLSVTVSGPKPAIEAFARYAKNHRLPCKVLDVEYPFHNALLDPIEEDLIAALDGLEPSRTRIDFYSTVSGNLTDGETLDNEYWWHNVRAPVRFVDAVKSASEDGCQLFCEIGPRPVVKGYLTKIANELERGFSVIGSFERHSSDQVDPVKQVFARAIANGAQFDEKLVFGEDWKINVDLPTYPWQLKPYTLSMSSEAIQAMTLTVPPHLLLGRQARMGDYIWTADLDTNLLPFLNDHRVDDKVILPGAVFAEIAVAAGSTWLGTGRVEMRDMDILHALTLSDEYSVQVKTRLNTETGTIEISSRKRLSDDDWQLHARCRVAEIPGDIMPQAVAPELRAAENPQIVERLYKLSKQQGVDFGPLFRRMIRCEEVETDRIEVVLDERNPLLDPNDGESMDYLLHPLDLDACFHGLNPLYDKLDLGSERLAFIPVRFGLLRLYQPGKAVRTARLIIRRSNKRGGQGDFELFDADGELVATLQDARFRATALVRRHTLDSAAYSFTAKRLPFPAEADKPVAIQLEKLLSEQNTSAADAINIEEQRLILELAARRAIHDVLTVLANSDSRVDMDHPIVSQHQRLVTGFLAISEQSELAVKLEQGWQLAEDCSIPQLDELVQTLLAEEPRWGANCILLNRASRLLQDIFSGKLPLSTLSEDGTLPYSSSLLDQVFSASPVADMHIHRVTEAFKCLLSEWPEDKALRVLELGAGKGGLTGAILPLISARRGHLTSVDEDKLNIAQLDIAQATNPFFETLLLDEGAQVLDKAGYFDVLVSADGISGRDIVFSKALQCLVPGGVVLCSVSEADVYQTLVLAPFDEHITNRSTAGFAAVLQANGFSDSHQLPLVEDSTSSTLIIAQRDSSVTDLEPVQNNNQVLIITAEDSNEQLFVENLLPGLRAAGIEADDVVVQGFETDQNWPELNASLDLVYLCHAFDAAEDSLETLSWRTQNLTSLLQSLGDVELRLWILAPGAIRNQLSAGGVMPAQTGIWSFARTASNEFGHIDIRLVDFDEQLSLEQCADRFAVLLADPGDQSEIVLCSESLLSLRAQRGLPLKQNSTGVDADNHRAVLIRPVSGSLDDLQWRLETLPPLQAEEVRIAVVATGLNFRDVMWAQGLLPEEALEDGFSGPTMGLECSGTVIATGDQVRGLRAGDKVMALAPASFSSEVIVDHKAVAKMPDTLDLTAAATVPVAFITAYYALHHLAHLDEGEWVLIHGGAGGVGLAALQIAKWSGARVIATAGSDEKRQFLQLLGADHVLNTRSLDFVDQVRSILAKQGLDGIDVVLNSLAGEAMERSLELLRPFGRFLELGKRDYYGNTKIGLRPFRRNISYFGIDADQLLNHQPGLAQRLFNELMQLFAEETLVPLPYRLYNSENVLEAFRLMQQSGHVGKIVVQAPEPAQATTDASQVKYEVDASGTHVIVGGLGGFGLETARWLADLGARSIVLTSRTGNTSPEVESILQELEKTGVNVEVACCDVTDEQSVKALFERLRQQKPIKGIMHVAMVLDDALIQNLDVDRIQSVLKPKALGVEYLDSITREDELDYFVMFSSSSALFGNPGQANYVAANAYLDGVAYRRRAEGLPALSVQWGAITDVGVLTRMAETAESLARHTGGQEFKAQQGLELLGQVLASHEALDKPAVISLAAMNWGFAGSMLPVMRHSTFELMAREAAKATVASEVLDIKTLVDGLDDIEARDKIAVLIADEAAQIFRMPVEEINKQRSLVELGMDSLMAMELYVAAEQKLGIELPMTSIADGTTINDIAGKVLMRARNEEEVADTAPSAAQLMAKQHLGEEMDTDQMQAIVSRVEAAS